MSEQPVTLELNQSCVKFVPRPMCPPAVCTWPSSNTFAQESMDREDHCQQPASHLPLAPRESPRGRPHAQLAGLVGAAQVGGGTSTVARHMRPIARASRGRRRAEPASGHAGRAARAARRDLPRGGLGTEAPARRREDVHQGAAAGAAAAPPRPPPPRAAAPAAAAECAPS